MASAGYSGGKGGCGAGSCYGAGSASYGKGASYGTGGSYGRGTSSYGSGNRPSAYGSNTQMYGKLGASSIYAQSGGKNNPAGLYGKLHGINTKNGGLYSTSGGMPPFLLGLMKGYQNSKNGTDGAKPYKTAPRPNQPDQKYNPGKENPEQREDEHKCPRCGGFSLFGAVCPPCK